MRHLAKLMFMEMGDVKTTFRDTAAIGSGPWRTSLRVLHLGNLAVLPAQALAEVSSGHSQYCVALIGQRR